MSDVLVLETKTPVARKSHTCELCRRTIRPGERYQAQHNVYDGHAYTWKGCAHCQAYAAVIWADNDGWLDDAGLDWMSASDYEPDTLWKLRLKAQYRRQWTRADGSLMPVPRLIRCWVFTPRTYYGGRVAASRTRRILGVTYEPESKP